MRRNWKRATLLAVATATTACVLFATLTVEREPAYQGRSLTDWATDPRATLFDAAGADVALRSMGPNVIPHLLRWISDEPPRWLTPLRRLCDKFPILLRIRPVGSAIRKASREPAFAFGLLGTNGAPALPELARIAADTRKPPTAKTAQACIYYILISDWPPTQFLTNALSSPDPFIREEADYALHTIQEFEKNRMNSLQMMRESKGSGTH